MTKNDDFRSESQTMHDAVNEMDALAKLHQKFIAFEKLPRLKRIYLTCIGKRPSCWLSAPLEPTP